MSKPKRQKGTVAVRAVKERLRLVWSFCGKRYFFALELSDTKANRAIADLRAKVIERDLVNRLFDPTLRKYRGDWVEVRLTVVSSFEKFIEPKTPYVWKDTLIKYRGMLTHLQEYFKSKGSRDVGAAAAIDADKPGAFLRIYGWSNQKLWWGRPRQGD